MTETTVEGPLDALEVFIGDWHMTTSLTPDPVDAPRARTTWEWMPGRRFLVQRWEIQVPEAPDGIAIIGLDTASGGYRQHYFDSRGVARIYQMTVSADTWTLERLASPPDFSQRFTGELSADHDTIVGRWEIAPEGTDWTHDFDLTYTRVG